MELRKLGLKAAFFACMAIAISTPKFDSMHAIVKTFVAKNHSTYRKAEDNVVQEQNSGEGVTDYLSELFINLQAVASTLPKLKEIQVKLLDILNNPSFLNNSKIIEILDWVIDLSTTLNRITTNLSKARNSIHVAFNESQEGIYRYIAKNSVPIISISRELINIKKEYFMGNSYECHEITFSDNEKLAISSLRDSLLKG